jgi:hypothetical protein
MRRRSVQYVTAAAVPAGLLVLLFLPAAAAPAPSEQVPKDLTPEAMKAIEKGLAWLAKNQNKEGAWAYGAYGGGDASGNVGITGLAGIAFLAGGHQPGRGQYGDSVERAMRYVASKTNMRTGYITSGNSRMYEHGFAALFLSEVYGMTRREDVKAPLRMAVNLIENCQNPQGGWRYTPTPVDADISVTICQIMALRSARNSGIRVSKKVIDGGVKYVKSCQNGDGGFSYQPTQGMGGSGYARTAAGVCSLYYAGSYGDPGIQKGLDYLARPNNNEFAGFGNGHYFYGHYYAVQAMYQAGGKYWAGYFPKMREELIKHQNADGSWHAQTGGTFETAVALIILQVPYGYLPILQR